MKGPNNEEKETRIALWIFCLVLFSPILCGAQSSGFILLSSTIGPIANSREWRETQGLKK